MKLLLIIPFHSIKITRTDPIRSTPFRILMIDLSPDIMFAPHRIDTLRHIQAEAAPRIRTANDIIQHDIGIAIT